MEIDGQINSGKDGSLMKAANLDIPENKTNVLFQPAPQIHAQIPIMEDQSISTEPNEKIMYDTEVDPTMMKADRM